MSQLSLKQLDVSIYNKNLQANLHVFTHQIQFLQTCVAKFCGLLDAQSRVDIQRSFWFIALLTAVSKIPFKFLFFHTFSAVGVEQRMIYHLFFPLVSRRKHHNLVFSMCASLLYSSRVIGEVTSRNLRFNIKSRVSSTGYEMRFHEHIYTCSFYL